MTSTRLRQSWLRNSLLGNAVFSTLSGLTFAFGAGTVAGLIGVEAAALVRSVGVSLLGFAAFIVFVATRSEIDPKAALAIVVGDLGWVVATIPVLMLGGLSGTGQIVAVVIADVVLLFAGLQYYGVRKMRAGSAVAEAAV